LFPGEVSLDLPNMSCSFLGMWVDVQTCQTA
jgi:hypothetical protein